MAASDASSTPKPSSTQRDQMVTMADALRVAAMDPDLGRRLATAETTCSMVIGDRGLTALLDREPIEVLDYPTEDAEVHISGSEQEWLPVFKYGNLAVALARGGLRSSGPVRKYLRIFPIFRTVYNDVARGIRSVDSPFVEPEPAPSETQATSAPWNSDSRSGGATARSGFTAEQEQLLDQASDYQYHSGALSMAEEAPGDFWSVECIDVHKTFGGNAVLNGVSLGIPEGSITVILGPSGTGKSVLINHLIGLMFPDQGDVLLHGRSVPDMTRSELFGMRRNLGVLFQDGALFGSMNLYDNVAFPLREHTSKSESEIRDLVMRRLEEVGLRGAIDRMPNELSGGMRKRAGFARALVMEPQIVLFDEPDSGLDPVRTALLCNLIRQVHSEHGGTYIVITHDIASVRRLGEYIAVLWKGRIVESGDAGSMFKSENPFVRQFLTGDSEGPLGME